MQTMLEVYLRACEAATVQPSEELLAPIVAAMAKLKGET
jgi:hypothetical protein